MRNQLLIIILLLGTSGFVHSQTLQFSRVFNLKGVGVGSKVPIDTVPAGKVWKIENLVSLDVTIFLSFPAGGQDIPLTYGSNNRPSIPPGLQGTGTLMRPYWLGEGEVIKANGVNSLDVFDLSIIEFTVVP